MKLSPDAARAMSRSGAELMLVRLLPSRMFPGRCSNDESLLRVLLEPEPLPELETEIGPGRASEAETDTERRMRVLIALAVPDGAGAEAMLSARSPNPESE